MTKQKKMSIAVLAVTLVVGGALLWRPWQEKVPTDTAFRVGDRAVSVSELDQRNDSLRALYGIEEPLADDERAEFRRRAAKSMAIGIVLDRAVEEAGVEVPAAEIDAALDAFIDGQFAGDRDAFVDSLGNVNTSEDAVREEISRQLALRKLLDEVAGDVVVTEEQVRAAFVERRDSLGKPERRVVHNIVVSTRSDARAVRQDLDRGTPVADLARRTSIDAATRETGGKLGTVARSELLPAVAKAVFATDAGQVYGPVQAPQGWNVGVVSRVLPPAPATLAGVRADLRQTLEAEEAQRIWSAWLVEELRAADVRYEKDYRPADPYDVSAWEDPAAGTDPGGASQ